MSKGETLYVKGMHLSESEHEDENVDVWDDKKLNEAYDKAVNIANAEIAKRIAMSTNNRTQHAASTHSTTQNADVKKKPKSATKKLKKDTIIWKPGMPCRAIYADDRLEYEAVILRILNDKECIVRFLGYENSEVVSINVLKPSLGSKERSQQIEEALNANIGSPHGEVSRHTVTMMDCNSIRSHSPSSTERSHHKKNKSSKNRNLPKTGFQLPMNPPFLSGLPAMNMNFSTMDIPMPPPPPLPSFSASKPDNEDDAIQSMLLSWYMTGYYTGLYQGMKKGKHSSRGDHQ